jgi:hypothetical protein
MAGATLASPEYVDRAEPPPARPPPVPPADDVVRALKRLNHTLELELAVLRVEQAAEQLRAVAVLAAGGLKACLPGQITACW